jgi:hypothetical protein
MAKQSANIALSIKIFSKIKRVVPKYSANIAELFRCILVDWQRLRLCDGRSMSVQRAFQSGGEKAGKKRNKNKFFYYV